MEGNTRLTQKNVSCHYVIEARALQKAVQFQNCNGITTSNLCALSVGDVGVYQNHQQLVRLVLLTDNYPHSGRQGDGKAVIGSLRAL